MHKDHGEGVTKPLARKTRPRFAVSSLKNPDMRETHSDEVLRNVSQNKAGIQEPVEDSTKAEVTVDRD